MNSSFAETFEKQVKAIKDFGTYEVQIGVFESETDRGKDKDDKKGRAKNKEKRLNGLNAGITNAGLMFIHEYGSPGRGIPPRPVLQMSLDYLQSTLLPQTLEKIYSHVFDEGYGKTEIEIALKQMCMRLQNYAHSLIEEDKLGHPLKHRKGIPLLDTGQLMRSIQCVLFKDGHKVE